MGIVLTRKRFLPCIYRLIGNSCHLGGGHLSMSHMVLERQPCLSRLFLRDRHTFHHMIFLVEHALSISLPRLAHLS